MIGKARSWFSAPKSWLRSPSRLQDSADQVPPERMNRMYVSLRRRLSDKIEDVLEEACMIRDIDTAEELLQVLEFMRSRQPEPEQPDRRSRDEALERAKVAVERLRKACGAAEETAAGKPSFSRKNASTLSGD